MKTAALIAVVAMSAISADAAFAAAPASDAATNLVPPPLETDAAGYFVELNGASSGPHAPEAIAAMRRDGRVDAQTRVWTEGMPTWAPIASVAALNDAGPTPPPLPARPVDDGRFTDAQCASMLLGSWRSDVMVAGATVSYETDLRPDGTFVQIISADIGLGSSAQYLDGEWEAFGAARGRCTMRTRALVYGVPQRGTIVLENRGPNAWYNETSMVDVVRIH